jgi:ketosteroid isomerase-like protein
VSTGQRIVDAFVAGDSAGIVELLTPDATFHSPVTDYHGSERVAEVLGGVVQVITDVRVTRVLEDGDATAAFFEARCEGRRAEGVLLVVTSAELTLMIRPLKTLLAGVERMKVLLARESAD